MNNTVVIGGGMAGVSAACSLADKESVTLVERTSRLGGRASSFPFAGQDLQIDYGHHVVMRCCRQTIAFLKSIGANECVSFQDSLCVPLVLDNKTYVLSSTSLPGPIHLLPSLLGYSHLSFSKRLRILRAGISLLTRNVSPSESFSSWLKRYGQDEEIRKTFWDPICIATLNDLPEAVSISTAQFVFKNSFFQNHGADLGLFNRPLASVSDRAYSYLEQQGADIHLDTEAVELITENGRIAQVKLASGETLQPTNVVVAVPPHNLLPLLPDDVARLPYFANLNKLTYSPIVDLHLFVDRKIMDELFVIFIGSPLQALFDLTTIHGKFGPPYHIVLSQSAAHSLIDLSTEAIFDNLLSALEKVLPRLSKARVIDKLVVKFPKATITPSVGIDDLRPATISPIDGLYLAGDYVAASDWPSTIEAAVRSGIAASRLVASSG